MKEIKTNLLDLLFTYGGQADVIYALCISNDFKDTIVKADYNTIMNSFRQMADTLEEIERIMIEKEEIIGQEIIESGVMFFSAHQAFYQEYSKKTDGENNIGELQDTYLNMTLMLNIIRYKLWQDIKI